MKRICHIDFETRSPLGIKACGAYRQMEDPGTEPLCLAFHLSDSPRYSIWVPRAAEFGDSFVNALAERYETYIYTNIPRPLLEAIQDPDCTFVSHNIEFELAVWNMICAKRYGWPELKLTQIDCTMARCGACNLPLGLDEAAVALGLGVTKDKEGRAIMLKMSGVRKLSSGNAWVWTPHDLRKLIDYCVQDIKVEERIDATLAPLSTIQRDVFRTNLEINIRGFFTDEDLIAQAFRFADLTCKRIGSLAEFRTNGKFNEAKLRSPGALVKTLAEEYFFDLPNAEADTIEALSKNPELDEEIRFVLACRSQIAKTSVSKFKKFKDMRSEFDGRVRGCYFYHAAGTGRFGGRGVQTQNLYKPRKWVVKEDGTKKSLWPEFVELIRAGDFDNFWSLLSSLPKTTVPKGMSALADCIRPVIRAHPDYTLVAADWSAIEARGVQWLAGDAKGLALFRDFDIHERWADDPYVKMIAYVQGVSPEKITDSERAIGKTIVLGCGYAMGKDRFFQTATEWGTPVSMEMAERCVIAFRELHEPVKKLWYNTNAAAIKAVQEPGTIQKVKGSEMTMYKSDGATLKCRLPSGRLLWYWSPVVKIEPTPWGKMSPHLYYKGVDGFTHKWTEFGIHGGVLVENNTQGICADLLMEALLRLTKTKYKVIHHVHDEIVAEIHAAKATDIDLFQFENLMQVVPAWAQGFPLKAKGWMGDHYRK